MGFDPSTSFPRIESYEVVPLLAMAGLDPAIHAQPARIFQASVDARIKSDQVRA